jgi:HD-like signal output (HDOD) protein/ActR/RegA family two-component response regulator
MITKKSVVTIFLNEEDRACKLAADLAGDRIELLLAQTPADFYRMLNSRPVELVVIENELVGFPTGLELLERLHKNLLRPSSIVLGNSNARMRKRATEMGVDALLPAGVTSEALEAAVTSTLANPVHRVLVLPEAARKLVLHSDVIEPLPRVLVKSCGYLFERTASVDSLARDIANDPNLTAELLKITNSTAFGMRRKAPKAARAVKFHRIRRTVSLVMTSGIIKMQSRLLKKLPDAVRKWYCQRSVLIASTAAAFARNVADISPDTAHVLGLMQDLGILIMTHGLGSRYEKLLKQVQEDGDLCLEIAEKQEFEISHADVSAALLMKWKLPPSLVTMVADHHDRKIPATRSRPEDRYLHVMRVGEAVANLGDKFFPQRHERLTALVRSYGAEMAERCKESLAAAVSKGVEASQLFATPILDEPALAALLLRIPAGPEHAGPAEGADETGDMPSINGNSWTFDVTEAPARKLHGEILVIEDELAILEAITGIAESVGLEVLSCSDRARANELAPRAAAIVCDIHLPNDRGPDVVRELRQRQYSGPVIFVSGDRTREIIADCVDAGMTDFLPKPVSEALLLETLSRYLGPVTHSVIQ